MGYACPSRGSGIGCFGVAWTYDGDLTSSLNQVRLLIGDVDTTDQQLQDEEITLFLGTTGPFGFGGNLWLAAAACCDALAARYARQVDTKIGAFSAVLSERGRAYQSRARDLRRDATRRGGILPYAGGLTIADKQTQEQDSGRVDPFFTRTTGDDEGGASGTMSDLGTPWGFGV